LKPDSFYIERREKRGRKEGEDDVAGKKRGIRIGSSFSSFNIKHTLKMNIPWKQEIQTQRCHD